MCIALAFLHTKHEFSIDAMGTACVMITAKTYLIEVEVLNKVKRN